MVDHFVTPRPFSCSAVFNKLHYLLTNHFWKSINDFQPFHAVFILVLKVLLHSEVGKSEI